MRSQKGFSLIEVMVVVSIMAVISLGMGQMLMGAAKNTARLEDQIAKMNFQSNMKTIFADMNACRANFEGQVPGQSNITQLTFEDGLPFLDLNDPYQKKISMLEALDVRLENPNDVAAGGTGMLQVVVDIKRDRAPNSQTPPITLDIPMQLGAGGHVDSCVASSLSSADIASMLATLRQDIIDQINDEKPEAKQFNVPLSTAWNYMAATHGNPSCGDIISGGRDMPANVACSQWCSQKCMIYSVTCRPGALTGSKPDSDHFNGGHMSGCGDPTLMCTCYH